MKAVKRLFSEEGLPILMGIFVTLGAIALRLALIRTARFTGDEADLWFVSRATALGDLHPQLGPPVSGGAARDPGPLFYYLMAIPELVSKTPEAANAFTALVGGLGVGLFWDGLRKTYGDWGSLLAASLMACAPWSTLFADRIWNANLYCGLVLVLFWTACKVRDNPRSWLIALLFALVVVLPQLHLSSPTAALAAFVLIGPSLRKSNKLLILGGVLVGLAFYEPALRYELESGWANARAFMEETGGVERSKGYLLVPLYVWRMMTLDVTYHTLSGYWGGLDEVRALKVLFTGTPEYPFSVPRLFALFASFALALLALASGARDVVRTLRARRRPVFFGTFFGAGITALLSNMAFLGLSGKAIFGHYVAGLLPFYYVAFAALGQRLENASDRAQISALILAAVTTAGGVNATLLVSRRIDARSGLATERAVLERIYKDMGPNTNSVFLWASFHFELYGYVQLAQYEYERPLFFWGGRAGSRYWLRAPGSLTDTDPIEGEPLLTIGPVVLYRL